MLPSLIRRATIRSNSRCGIVSKYLETRKIPLDE